MDHGNLQHAAVAQNAQPPRNGQDAVAIVIDASDEDEPGDIWVRPRLNIQQHQHMQPIGDMPHRSATGQRPRHTPRSRPREQPQQQPHPSSGRRRLEAIAAESSASDVDSSECIESDTNAQDLYREAIRGVRNARQARQQIRSATEHCPVCARFAAFLANFM
jgi:hypothetical protein